jgi:hypothetical protein
VLDCSWANGKVTKFKIHAPTKQKIAVWVNGKKMIVDTVK